MSESIFARHALPEVPLEELVQLRLAVGLYVEVMKRTARENRNEAADLALASRMYDELVAECQRRFTALGRGEPPQPGRAGKRAR